MRQYREGNLQTANKDGTLGNNTIKAHYFKQLLITSWGFSPIPLDAAFKMFFGLLMIKDLDFPLYTKYFYGVYLSADLCMEITENSKKWKPLLVKEEEPSIVRVNSSYLRSMNDYKVTFLYRTFKSH
ncbi:beta-1,3-galactosyltransferase 1 isoform X2 [Lonchura striata]